MRAMQTYPAHINPDKSAKDVYTEKNVYRPVSQRFEKILSKQGATQMAQQNVVKDVLAQNGPGHMTV